VISTVVDLRPPTFTLLFYRSTFTVGHTHTPRYGGWLRCYLRSFPFTFGCYVDSLRSVVVDLRLRSFTLVGSGSVLVCRFGLDLVAPGSAFVPLVLVPSPFYGSVSFRWLRLGCFDLDVLPLLPLVSRFVCFHLFFVPVRVRLRFRHVCICVCGSFTVPLLRAHHFVAFSTVWICRSFVLRSPFVVPPFRYVDSVVVLDLVPAGWLLLRSWICCVGFTVLPLVRFLFYVRFRLFCGSMPAQFDCVR